MSNKTRAVIYVRVFTRDGRQDTELQKTEGQAYCEAQGWSVTKLYQDHDTGAKSDRPAFREMMRDGQQHRFDVLVFWALDRFSREGVVTTQQHLAKLDGAGVRFHSVKESYLDGCGMFRGVVIALLAVLAKQERVRMSERIKAGNRELQAGREADRSQARRSRYEPLPDCGGEAAAPNGSRHWKDFQY